MTTENTIKELEEDLRRAELDSDPDFFERHIDNEMIFVAEGKSSRPKRQIVEAHKPGQGQRFTRVEMSEVEIIDHGDTAVVTCTGQYDGPNGTLKLKFLRVWARKADGWKVVAGAMI